MPLKPSVCIDAVLEGMSLDQAMRTASRLGFPAIEFWCWWEKDLDQVVQLKQELSLSVAACCTKFVSLVDPSVREQYLDGLRESIEAAKQLECCVLISQVGDAIPGVPRSDQHNAMVDGLRAAAKLLSGTGITLAIEPLNELVDHQGYYLIRSDEAFSIVEKVGSPSVKLTFDIYHQQISEGNLIENATRGIEHIAHFHAAGNPGRHELNCGEIHYPSVFAAIRQAGYDGFVGLEYWPVNDPEVGLKEALSLFS